ncbi:MAG: hypothetical protein Q4F75_00720 [Pseudomonadota bacterium]|nr:hypothetical protein [Pseudomonadota bacterium]
MKMYKKYNADIFDAELLKMYAASQSSIPSRYDRKSFNSGQYYAIEAQTAELLKNYLKRKVEITPDAYEYLRLLIHEASRSKRRELRILLRPAFRQLQIDLKAQKQQQKHQQKIGDIKYITTLVNSKKKIKKAPTDDLIYIKQSLAAAPQPSVRNILDKLNSHGQQRLERIIRREEAVPANIDEFSRLFGTWRQQNILRHGKYTPAPRETKVSLYHEVERRQKAFWPKIFHNSKEFLARNAKKIAVIGGILFAGLLAHKANKEITRAEQEQLKFDTEIKAQSQSKAQEKVKTIAASQFAVPSQTADKQKITADDALQKAYKNRFDTSLEILLGKEKRDNLYKQIDTLIEKGAIKYSGGTTREWYAHAFTMYDKIAPNSAENRNIRKLLGGEKQSLEYINNLVLQAGRNGKGVKGSGSYSAYNRAPKELQQRHNANNRQILDLQNQR